MPVTGLAPFQEMNRRFMLTLFCVAESIKRQVCRKLGMCVARVHISGLTGPSITNEIHMLPITAVALDDISLKFALPLLRFLSLNDIVAELLYLS